MPTALYPGSFDPITMGHIDIIRRASQIFDDLVIGVIHNPNKKSLFSLEKRKEMVREFLKDDKINAKVVSFEGLLVNFVKENKIKVIIRGLRATTDFEYELTLSLMNKELYPEQETIFLMASSQYSFVSSNLMKEVFNYNGDISKYVPPKVLEEMKKLKQ
ncbi:MAG TPA: pantetheine-phosphate adenylyltransferase [Spirochaetia bacterium]|nr:MAG: pantetheine-phosphate adenylyltransferase [Spirochaetes bacterium GWB1_36_13]HCL56852.1 pantetheine-phosphate adenylyltransferase [Spirochaetia bacterium]